MEVVCVLGMGLLEGDGEECAAKGVVVEWCWDGEVRRGGTRYRRRMKQQRGGENGVVRAVERVWA